MPVVNLDLKRLKHWFPGKSVEQLIEELPFIGLDIESTTSTEIRIEYNPNRPDFGSDYGIARSLKGYLDIELGIPKYNLLRSDKYKIISDSKKNLTRPFITGLVAKDLKLETIDIKQLSSTQDDLHDGIGRQKIKASIGIYPLHDIKFPLKYTSISHDFSFTFSNHSASTTVSEFLDSHGFGTKYCQLQQDSGANYSALLDKENQLISMPPFANFDTKELEPGLTDLFIHVTSIEHKLADDMTAILAALVNDMGSTLQTILVQTPEEIIYSPDLRPAHIFVSAGHVNGTLGTELTSEEIMTSLRRCRLEAKAVKGKGSTIICTIPRYRVDIFDKIDIVEEVAIGYGISNLIPSIPSSKASGNLSEVTRYLDIIRVTMVGLGYLEVNNFSLIAKKIQFDSMISEYKPDRILAVEGALNADLDYLRNSLLPSLMLNLSRNIHETYPQKIFEIGKVFSKEASLERWHLACLLASSSSNFTEAKSVLQGLLDSAFANDFKTEPDKLSHFTDGRCAKVIIGSECTGELGEISASVVDSFKLRVPVSGFEINLSKMLNIES